MVERMFLVFFSSLIGNSDGAPDDRGRRVGAMIGSHLFPFIALSLCFFSFYCVSS